jgi:RND family efflux transporter MFP subunit
MHLILKGAARLALGVGVLAVGVGMMNGLISMKEEMPVSDKPAAPRAVRNSVIEVGSIQPETPVEGRVEAMYKMDIMSEVTGNLLMGSKEFREGMAFGAGEVILAMDDTVARLALIAQRSQFLQLLTIQLADLQMDFDGRSEVWSGYVKSINVAETLPTLPEAASDRERLFLSNRGIVSSYHSIRSAEEKCRKFQVRAPFDGIVVQANVQPGALVRAGQMAGKLVGEGNYEVKTAVHARYLSTIQRRDSVRFYDEAGKIIATGTVNRIAGNVDPATQSASVFCRIKPSRKGVNALRDGRFLTGTIESAPLENTFQLPLAWVHDENHIFEVSEGKLKEREIEVLFRSRSHAIARGLESGTVVLSESLTNAFEGMIVRTKTNELED